MATAWAEVVAWSWGSQEGSAVAGGEYWEVTWEGLGLAGAAGAVREPRPRGVTGGQPLKQGSQGLNVGVPMAWSPGFCPQRTPWGLGVGSQPSTVSPCLLPCPWDVPATRAALPWPGPQGPECRVAPAWRGSTQHLRGSAALVGAWSQGLGVRERGHLPRGLSSSEAGLGTARWAGSPRALSRPRMELLTPLRATRGSQWRGAPAPCSLCGEARRGHQMAPGAR